MVALEAERNAGSGLPERDRPQTFFDAIDRPRLKEKITSSTPIVSFSMESAVADGFFAGGLGVLSACEYLQAGKLGIPYISVTPIYSKHDRQQSTTYITDKGRRFESHDIGHPFNLEESAWGFGDWNPDVFIRTNSHKTQLGIHVQTSGSAQTFGLHTPYMGEQYKTAPDSQHRMYQIAVLGFGGFRAVKAKGVNPSLYKLEESAAVCAALANFDDKCKQGVLLNDALQQVRQETIYVNHTLEQAAEAEIPSSFVEEYFIKNMESPEAIEWLRSFVQKHGGKIRLNTLAISLSREHVGVSQLHARVASGIEPDAEGRTHYFYDAEERKVTFESITNGIFMDRWTHAEYMKMYRDAGILSEFDLPASDYEKRIDELDNSAIQEIKTQAKQELVDWLKTRQDQYGLPIEIDKGAKIATWAKRFVPYKRPEFPFTDPKRLADLLVSENMHILISGKFGGDNYSEICEVIDKNPELKKRVHFVQGYDVDVAQKIIPGSDIWLNTPIVGKEACGTSIFKAISNAVEVVSTEDGGMADVHPPVYFQIGGEYDTQQWDTFYVQLQVAARKVGSKNSSDEWSSFVKGQLKAYLSIISGARMMKDYIYKGFPEGAASTPVLNGEVEIVSL